LATRPVVLVYQEYASLSPATADPELNACIVGPAYQIIDYPEDRLKIGADGSTTPNVAGRYGALNSCSGVPTAGLDLAYPNLMVGAVPDPVSVQVFAESIRVLVALGGAGGLPATATTLPGNVRLPVGVDLLAAGVTVGDYCTVKDANGKVLVFRVRSIQDGTAKNDVAVFTSEFPVDSTSFTNGPVAYQFERDANSGRVPAGSVSATTDKITVTPGFSLQNLPVLYAELLVAYRGLRTDLASYQTLTDFRLSSAGELGKVGKLDARNPLAVALYVAAQNTTTPLQFFGIPSDDVAGFETAKSALSSRVDVYALALLTDEPSVVKSFGDAFMRSADPDYVLANGISQRFRTALGYAGALPTTKLLVQESSALSITEATLNDPRGSFVDAGVIIGDLVRFLSAPGGAPVDLSITEVVSNQTLRFAGRAPGGGLTYEVIRDISTDKNAQVTALAALAKSFSNRRVVLCWPDLVDVTDLTDGSKARLPSGAKAPADPQRGYYLACAVAGLTAALPSHQGFTNFAVNGVKRVYNANPYFTDQQITRLSNAGLFVFTQDDAAALPYVVHALTTDMSTLDFAEFMAVKNMDYVSMALKDVLDGFIGKWNINSETIDFIRGAEQAELDDLLLDKRVRIGARLLSARISQLDTSTSSADRLELFVECKFPKVLNTIGLHIVSA
jgi:hypothetical protein